MQPPALLIQALTRHRADLALLQPRCRPADASLVSAAIGHLDAAIYVLRKAGGR